VTDVSYVAAFGAGILSFISPCVLPLVPGYISYISGVSFEDMKALSAPGGGAPDAVRKDTARSRRQILVTSAAFVVGFSIVFIGFGASATALGHALTRYKPVLEKVAGVLVILFGLHLAGIFRIRWLDKDTRVQTSRRPAGPFGALVVGVAFAFGWTPCIGPILGGILTIAGSKSTVREGIVLLAIYSAGLGIPFLLTSLAIDRFFIASARIRKYYKAIEVVSGALLVVLGLLIFTNRFTILANWAAKYLPTF
jgi:cytochrome c-type biogenesis protein